MQKLDEVTGRSGAEVDYVLSEPAKCPKCFGEVTEKTLVEGVDFRRGTARPVSQATFHLDAGLALNDIDCLSHQLTQGEEPSHASR